MYLKTDGKTYTPCFKFPSIDVPFSVITEVIARSIPKDVSINVMKDLRFPSDSDFEIEGSEEDFVTILIQQVEPQQFYGGLFNLPFYSEAKKEVIEESEELTLEYFGVDESNHFEMTYSFKYFSDKTITEIHRFVEDVINELEHKIYTKLIRLAHEKQKEIFKK
ncbi:hypothetical protein [Bacillus sp. AFS096315]|uniref:hypothetical protein n=1 Tax=Bacillus sp. AFS096315 TaxID=2033517 RepID=UPI000BECD3F8|nr:hypothetical protein [Bacillus sp. AFS096315]PEC50284.1 hypothetical protein CON00_06960 [Bacillus sp. AFS096315]